MTDAVGRLGRALSPPAKAGGIPEALLQEAAYEAHRLAATTPPDDVLKRIGEIDVSLEHEVIVGKPVPYSAAT